MEEIKKEGVETPNNENKEHKNEIKLEQLLTKFTNLEVSVNNINKQLENTFINKIELKDNPDQPKQKEEDFELG